MLSAYAHAQVNYVLNPSFEQYTRCPTSFDQIHLAKYWNCIDSSGDTLHLECAPEYCNECAGSNKYVGVPNNGYFFHYPRTGKGLAQIQTFFDESSMQVFRRDYLQGHLYTPLSADTSYCVTFYVTLDQQSEYAINHIGAYLDNGIIDTAQNCGLPQSQYLPQIFSTTIVNDTLNWVKIEGNFIATGNEKFITIGNFFSKANTNYIVVNPTAADMTFGIYLVDDVSVVESNIPAYAGGNFFKAKNDSVFIGRNEIVPDCEWYRNGVLIDTVHAGFWVKDTVNATYVVKQSICGNVKYDTAKIIIVPVGVNSVGNESIYRVYPNPATTEITIQAPNSTSMASMAVYDMSGKILLSNEVHFYNGAVRVPLSLSTGVYFVELMDEHDNKNIQRLSIL